MAKTPEINYFASRGAYYTQYQGKQRRLARGPRDEPDGPTYRAAVKKFSQLMGSREETQIAGESCLVSVVIVRYYQSLQREERTKSLHLARTLLDPAIAEFGHKKVAELKPFLVRDWLEKMTTWNSSTRHTAIGRLGRAFYWAKEEGLVTTNPIAQMKKPEKLARGKEAIIPEELQDLLIRLARPALARALRFLRETGCRPGEMIHAARHHYKKDPGALVFSWNALDYRWKNARKTRKDRVIYLTPEMVELVEGEIHAHQNQERIFLTQRGKPWQLNNLNVRVIALARCKEVRKWCQEHQCQDTRIMPYGFRHSYITRMLKKSCPIKLLADLCGTSVLMIERHYSKAHDDHQTMRKLFLQFSDPAVSFAQPHP